jgi:ectoine hydroxylase-related dioxygenase (phytanoyl-CoA dioxygenase family)
MEINFFINDHAYPVSIKDTPPLSLGKNEILSGPETDVVYDQSWYDEGHVAKTFLDSEEFQKLKQGLSNVVESLIQTHLGTETTGFNLEKYHYFVKNSEDHFKIVGKTRDLFPEDFHFPIQEMIPKFEKLLGFKLSDVDPKTKEKLHIIVRINRPGSTDYNPPHKDIYEEWDQNQYLPPFVNLWIPIAGVTEKSSLPIAPGSHRIPESEILRTFDGGVVEGNKSRKG